MQPNPKTLREEVEGRIAILRSQADFCQDQLVFTENPLSTYLAFVAGRLDGEANSLQAILARTGG